MNLLAIDPGTVTGRACMETDIEPKFKTYKGDNLLTFVISMNLKRRHLNESQRALIAAKMATMPAHRPDKSANLPTLINQPHAAKLLNVSERTLRSALALVNSLRLDLQALGLQAKLKDPLDLPGYLEAKQAEAKTS